MGMYSERMHPFLYIRKVRKEGVNMAYVLLGIAILAELFASTCLKYSAGFTKLLPSIACIIGYVVSFFIFSKALLSINFGVAYAIWCSVGIVVTTILSAVLFGEKMTMIGIAGIALIIAGCILVSMFGTKQ